MSPVIDRGRAACTGVVESKAEAVGLVDATLRCRGLVEPLALALRLWQAASFHNRIGWECRIANFRRLRGTLADWLGRPVKPNADDAAAMRWWNSLDELDRAYWLDAATSKIPAEARKSSSRHLIVRDPAVVVRPAKRPNADGTG